MSRPASLLAILSVLPAAALADTLSMLTCSQLLEQIATLQTSTPLYKLTTDDKRHYINDADRPAEIAHLQKLAAGSCSTDPQEKASEGRGRPCEPRAVA